ncbi:peptide-methionine (S)-S-oxide reductase [Lewinella marina]|uniref:peptide-methionine (S)-S-oxide reductase n=1 Tax=Neolewinella marina TaxID=438751 RepID=A0A2G0CDJ0_9BACT|nr:peptide-methionine (S)-S-oxide reductase [Neolewinella marina]NJB86048.1 peptide-methionine (S)-S-oxide reductase [Neolewinella marina]PHK97987.1 peptide methionine sulfoxide reductase [Neolewinella marina]
MSDLQRIGLGGGCHWCTEGVFVSLAGVVGVEQGWIASRPPHAAFSEAVIVHFDPGRIALAELLAVHLTTHAATSDHGLRGRYRSAVYSFNTAQFDLCTMVLGELGRTYERPLVTRVLPFAGFRASAPEYRDYYRSDPGRPFCRRYIAPKLERLRADRPYLFLTPKQ